MERRNFLRSFVIAPLAAFAAKLGFNFETPIPVSGAAAAPVAYATSRTAQQLEMLGQLLKSPEGRNMLAASLGPSLRRRRDYTSLCRKALSVQKDSIVRSLHENLNLYVVDWEGVGTAKLDIKYPSRIPIPTFPIVSNPMIPCEQIFAKRFDLVARCLNLSKAEIGACEEGYMFALFDIAAERANAGGVGNRDIEFDSDLQFVKVASARFEKQGVKQTEYLFANPKDCVEVMKSLTLWERNHARKTLKTGLIGWLDADRDQKVQLFQSRKVPRGFMYITGRTEASETGRADLAQSGADNAIYAGYVLEEVPLTVQSADRPDLEQIGFSVTEEIGFAVNPIAVQRVKV